MFPAGVASCCSLAQISEYTCIHVYTTNIDTDTHTHTSGIIIEGQGAISGYQRQHMFIPDHLTSFTCCSFFMEAGTPTKSQRTPGTTDPASRCTKWLFLVIFWVNINKWIIQPTKLLMLGCSSTPCWGTSCWPTPRSSPRFKKQVNFGTYFNPSLKITIPTSENEGYPQKSTGWSCSDSWTYWNGHQIGVSTHF